MIDDELDLVQKKAERMARARRHRGGIWSQVAHAGTLGLLLALPPVIGAGIGHWRAKDYGEGAAPIVGILIGLAIGILLAVIQIRVGLAKPRQPPEDP